VTNTSSKRWVIGLGQGRENTGRNAPDEERRDEGNENAEARFHGRGEGCVGEERVDER
jgi:hypothetical protein